MDGGQTTAGTPDQALPRASRPGKRRRSIALPAAILVAILAGLAWYLAHHGLSAEEWASRPIDELQTLARREPRNPGPPLGLGIQYARAGDPERAAAMLKRCLALAPDTEAAYAGLGEIARERGDELRAGQMYARAVALDPGFDEGYLQAANAFTHLQIYQRARPYAAAYARRLPRDWRGPFLLGMISAGEGQMAEALAHYQEAVRRAPQHAPAYLNAGATYLYGPSTPQRLSAAAGWFQRGLALDPHYPELHYYLGLVRFRQRRWSEASRALHEAVSLEPSLTEAYYPLAQSLEKLGRKEEAKLCLSLYTRLRSRERHG